MMTLPSNIVPTSCRPLPQESRAREAASPPRKIPRLSMVDVYEPWVSQTYGDSAKTKTITRNKYQRILQILRGDYIDNETSKFKLWVKGRGFRIGPPAGYVAPPDLGDVRLATSGILSAPHTGLDYNPDKDPRPDIFVQTGTSKDTEGNDKISYKKVAVVEDFFEIIYNLHVVKDGKDIKHMGQKRTYRAVSDRYAFVPREAVTKFLVLCTECPRRSSGNNLSKLNNNNSKQSNNNNLISSDVLSSKLASAFEPIVSRSGVEAKKVSPSSSSSVLNRKAPHSFLTMAPTHPTAHSIISFLPAPSPSITSHSINSLLTSQSSPSALSHSFRNPLSSVGAFSTLSPVCHSSLLHSSFSHLLPMSSPSGVPLLSRHSKSPHALSNESVDVKPRIKSPKGKANSPRSESRKTFSAKRIKIEPLSSSSSTQSEAKLLSSKIDSPKDSTGSSFSVRNLLPSLSSTSVCNSETTNTSPFVKTSTYQETSQSIPTKAAKPEPDVYEFNEMDETPEPEKSDQDYLFKMNFAPSKEEEKDIEMKVSSFSSSVNYSLPITAIYKKHMDQLQHEKHLIKLEEDRQQQIKTEHERKQFQDAFQVERLQMDMLRQYQQQYMVQNGVLPEEVLRLRRELGQHLMDSTNNTNGSTGDTVSSSSNGAIASNTNIADTTAPEDKTDSKCSPCPSPSLSDPPASIADDSSTCGGREDDEDEEEETEERNDPHTDPERLKAFNMFVRMFVDENLDRFTPISKQPKEKVQAIIDACARQFPEFGERTRKRIRTYLKSCRRNKRTRDSNGWTDGGRPTPPHLTSIQAEQLLAAACDNEAQNAKRMKMGIEPVSQPLPCTNSNTNTNVVVDKPSSFIEVTSAVKNDMVPARHLTDTSKMVNGGTPGGVVNVVNTAGGSIVYQPVSSTISPSISQAPVYQQQHVQPTFQKMGVCAPVSNGPTDLSIRGTNNAGLSAQMNPQPALVTTSGMSPSCVTLIPNNATNGGGIVINNNVNANQTSFVNALALNQQQQNPSTPINMSNSVPVSQQQIIANAQQMQQHQQEVGAVKSRPSLSAVEVAAVRQLITGYKESAAFLLRSAEELQNLILQQQAT